VFGPWQYRRFLRWTGYFFRLMPWFWFIGMGALLAVSMFRLDARYGITMGMVAALTIWPAILGWLGITGLSIVWRFALAVLHAMRRKQLPDSLALAFSLSVLVAGLVFLWGAVVIISVLIKHSIRQ